MLEPLVECKIVYKNPEQSRLKLTEEEENGLIDGLITEIFRPRVQNPCNICSEVIKRSAFMQLTFDELKSTVNPPIKNLKVEIKIEPT